MERITLRLTIDVTYDAEESQVNDLVDNLLALPTLAMQNGLLTADTEAEVVIANPNVERLA